MFDSNGSIKLIDFGLSIYHSTDEEHDQHHEIAGTPNYIAPEVLNGEWDKECDIWALGVVLYELLTKELPFMGQTNKELCTNIRKGYFIIPDFYSKECR